MIRRPNTSLYRGLTVVGFAAAGTALAVSALAKPPWKDPTDWNDPAEVVEIRTLHFGTIAPDRLSPGTVRVRSNRDNSSQCDRALTCLEGGTRGQFRVSGGTGRLVQLTLPQQATLRNPGGATMTVDDFRIHARGFLQGRGKLKKNDPVTISVGAVLTVGAMQPVGRYEGTYEINLAYE